MDSRFCDIDGEQTALQHQLVVNDAGHAIINAIAAKKAYDKQDDIVDTLQNEARQTIPTRVALTLILIWR